MSTERKPHVGIRSIGHTEPDYRFPKITATRDGLSASFDLTPMVHDLTRQVLKRVEEGAADEVIAFLAANGHLAEVIRKAKAEAWQEGFVAGVNADMGDYEHPPEIIINPYAEES